jgi:hypothetical protein
MATELLLKAQFLNFIQNQINRPFVLNKGVFAFKKFDEHLYD